ncbi:uncharacterized protein LOC125684320 isoform X3 [Lagopus muta]|uniref:uncharacterized protein LOC125684320 isoform X3 n=1 Tax=Lagopus muta TaxID=64668 RepID=UPI0020A16886|nr:uncharacterized protein LOC125684320 isoform X3 [Lagopus muta]
MHSIAKESQARVAAKSRRIQTNSVKSRRGRRNQRCCSLCSGKAALATLWRREALRLPFGPCLSPTCQQSSQVLSVKYQSGVLLLSLGWMPEKETWRIGEYPQRLCHVLKEMVEEKAAQGPERQKEAWRIGEYPQRLCHVLKEMVEEKAAQGPERQKEAWRIAEYPQRLCHVLKEMVKEKAAQGPERQKEAWRIGEYPQRLCHVLKEMVEEKAAQAEASFLLQTSGNTNKHSNFRYGPQDLHSFKDAA